MIIYGRSDATLNPGGVRIGTAEIYRQVEQLPEIRRGLVIGQDWDWARRRRTRRALRPPSEGVASTPPWWTASKRISDNTTPPRPQARVVQVQDIPAPRAARSSNWRSETWYLHQPVKNVYRSPGESRSLGSFATARSWLSASAVFPHPVAGSGLRGTRPLGGDPPAAKQPAESLRRRRIGETLHGAMLKTMALQSEPHERGYLFQVLVQTVTGSFPTDARHLDAAKGGDLGRDQAGIDADHAVFELLRDAPDAAVVPGKRNRQPGRIPVSLAIRTASSSVSKRNSGATGPKISSLATAIAVVTPAGSSARTRCAQGMALAAGHDAAPSRWRP